MKKIIFFLTAISLFTFHGCQKDPGTIDNRIAITDKVITSGGSADISGMISCPIENINIELLVDDAEDMSTPTKYNIHINSDNSFTANITDLNPTTTYYYKYVAHTAVDMTELDKKSFTTMDATLPTVSTNNLTSITPNTAVCGGNVTEAGNAPVTSRGVCWSTSPNPTINDNKTTDGTGSGSFTSNITGLAESTTYYVRAYATNSKGTAYGEGRSFSTTPSTGTLVGHDWVDLGLPSGLKWATCNVGATSPEDYGNYYAWGETSTKSEYTYDNSITFGQQMPDISGNATYDAARANWGGSWRMPTKAEMEELRDNCTWTWTSQNGVNGMRVTGSNGNSIFLSAAGYCDGSSRYNIGEYGIYWSSTPSSGSSNAYHLFFDSLDLDVNCNAPYCGHTVRPVSE